MKLVKLLWCNLRWCNANQTNFFAIFTQFYTAHSNRNVWFESMWYFCRLLRMIPHWFGASWFLNIACGTEHIVSIYISTAHTPWPSLTSNHAHTYTNCMNNEWKTKLRLNIWRSSYCYCYYCYCVCSIDIPDLAPILVFCCFVFASQMPHLRTQHISRNTPFDWLSTRCFDSKWLCVFFFVCFFAS